jgi:hypothetical protein
MINHIYEKPLGISKRLIFEIEGRLQMPSYSKAELAMRNI